MPRRERPLKRRQPTRDERQRILIVTEGAKTEVIYFDGIRRVYRRPKELWRIEPGGGHPQAIVDRTDQLVLEANRVGDAFDQVWWVFDVEAPIPHPGIDIIINKAESLRYRCAISHPCFELWLVLHFQNHTSALTSANAERLAKACGCEYAEKSFDFVKVWPLHEQAISNAMALHTRQVDAHPRLIDRNPWTSVHELIAELIRLGERDR
jgi:hypothetical protein